MSIPTSSVMEIQMFAGAQAFSAGGEGAQSASAYLDPYFSVDPSTPNADQYSILISEGIGNARGTPEPSTWAMILVGFAGMGFFARRRMRQKLDAQA